MKHGLTLSIILLVAFGLEAQINGNGNFKTINIELPAVEEIDIQFNATITLDYMLAEGMMIRADENVLEFIGIEFKDGKLKLDQIKWIEPSELPTITIGCPKLNYVYQGTHSSTFLKNVQVEELKLAGNVGSITAEGRVDKLSIHTTGTDMDLSKMEIENAFVSIDDDSKVTLDQVKNLKTELDEDARLILLSEVPNMEPKKEKTKTRYAEVNPDLRWIDFKIKNNSLKRNHFIVVGPKKDGLKFSYGFSLFPGASKTERWSVGTKIYREKRSGARGELLVMIEAADEGGIVELFK